MAWRVLWFHRLRRASSCVLSHSSHPTLCPLPYFSLRYVLLPYLKSSNSFESRNCSFISRDFSHGSVNLVLSDGKPKFEIHEVDAPKKEKWKTKKRLKMQRKREKRKKKEANRRDPRCIRPKGQKKKQKFPNAEARIKSKIEKEINCRCLVAAFCKGKMRCTHFFTSTNVLLTVFCCLRVITIAQLISRAHEQCLCAAPIYGGTERERNKFFLLKKSGPEGCPLFVGCSFTVSTTTCILLPLILS